MAMMQDWRITSGEAQTEVRADNWLGALAAGLPEIGFDLGGLGRLVCATEADGSAVARDPRSGQEVRVTPLGAPMPPSFEMPISSFASIAAPQLRTTVTEPAGSPEPTHGESTRGESAPAVRRMAPPAHFPATLRRPPGEGVVRGAAAPAPVVAPAVVAAAVPVVAGPSVVAAAVPGVAAAVVAGPVPVVAAPAEPSPDTLVPDALAAALAENDDDALFVVPPEVAELPDVPEVAVAPPVVEPPPAVAAVPTFTVEAPPRQDAGAAEVAEVHTGHDAGAVEVAEAHTGQDAGAVEVAEAHTRQDAGAVEVAEAPRFSEFTVESLLGERPAPVVAPPPAPERAVAPAPVVPPAPAEAPALARDLRVEPPPRLIPPPPPPSATVERDGPGRVVVPAAVRLDDRLEELFMRLGEILDAPDPAAACAVALRLANELIPADAGAVLVRTRAGDALRFRAALGPAAASVLDTTIPLDRGIAGFCFQLGLALTIDDAHRDNRHYGRVDRSTGYQTRTLLAAPVRADDGGVYGVLELINPPRPFTADDLELASRVAATLGGYFQGMHQ